MSKHDFSADEFAARLKLTRNAIAAAGLDWLLVFHPVSIHWLTGSDAKSYQEFQCLFVSAEEKPLAILTRQGEFNEYRDDALVDEIHLHGGGNPQDPIAVFERLAKVLSLQQSRVGMEVPAYYLHPHYYTRIREFLGDALVAEPTNLIADLKMVKSPAEISYIRKAGRIADIAMDVFAHALREGRAELEIAGEVYRSLLSSGSGLAASPINLVSGDRSCFSHGAPTSRKLQQGDFGNVEYGATYKRYTSTIGRQFCLGKPTARMRELYDVMRRASDTCIAEIRVGVPATVPHQAAKKVIEEAGLEHGRVHLSGYGLAPGFPPSWAEPIHLFGDSKYILQAGMVLTVEPPVFLGDEHLGARIIDNVLVTENGAELLSRFSRDLMVVQ
jgi:Xaa-Pro dipeptidase